MRFHFKWHTLLCLMPLLAPVACLVVDIQAMAQSVPASASSSSNTLDSPSQSAAIPASGMHLLDAVALGKNSITISAVSGDGRVVAGSVHDSSGKQAFRWTRADGLDLIGDLPGGQLDSHATDLSSDGATIVGYGTSVRGRTAWVWTASEGMKELPEHNNRRPVDAVAVSRDGQIIAGHFGDFADSPNLAFSWHRAKGYTPLQSTITMASKSFPAISKVMGISQNGQVCAGLIMRNDVDFQNACVWVDGTGAPIRRKEFDEGVSRYLPGFIGTRTAVSAVATDPKGIVCGVAGRYINKERGSVRGYAISDGRFSWLESQHYCMSYPNSISDDGKTVIGTGVDASGKNVALIWRDGQGLKSVSDFLKSEQVTASNDALISASDASADSRVIVGQLSRQVAFVATLK